MRLAEMQSCFVRASYYSYFLFYNVCVFTALHKFYTGLVINDKKTTSCTDTYRLVFWIGFTCSVPVVNGSVKGL